MKAIYLEEAIERFSESGSSLSKDQIIYMLNRMPYTEIVRCGDCRHKYVKDMSAYCPNRVGAVNAWDFCSFGERSGYCEHAKNLSGDIWECDCFLDTYCEHQIYDRNPDGTLNIVKCGERSEE